MKVGIEVWTFNDERIPFAYTVAPRDRAHFLAGDGDSLEDTRWRMNRASYARYLVDYDVLLGADGIDVIVAQCGGNIEFPRMLHQLSGGHANYRYYKATYYGDY